MRRPSQSAGAGPKALLLALSMSATLGGWGILARGEGAWSEDDVTEIKAAPASRARLPTVLPAPTAILDTAAEWAARGVPELVLAPIPEIPVPTPAVVEEPETPAVAAPIPPSAPAPIVAAPALVAPRPAPAARPPKPAPTPAAPAPPPAAKVTAAPAPKPAPTPKPAGRSRSSR